MSRNIKINSRGKCFDSCLYLIQVSIFFFTTLFYHHRMSEKKTTSPGDEKNEYLPISNMCSHVRDKGKDRIETSGAETVENSNLCASQGRKRPS